MAEPTEETLIEHGSGNVFADLGFENADEMLAKANLAIAIKDAIKNRGLTEVQTAELISVDPSKVARIMRGRLLEFSTEELLHLLVRLGQDVEIVIHKEAKPAQREGLISVAYV